MRFFSWVLRFLAWKANCPFYLDRDGQTVRRVWDGYGYHTEAEFFAETGLREWGEISRRLIY